MPNHKQPQAFTDLVRRVANAIVETIEKEGADGAPASSLYLALQQHGASLQTFEMMMNALVAAGRVRREGDCYYPVKRGPT